MSDGRMPSAFSACLEAAIQMRARRRALTPVGAVGGVYIYSELDFLPEERAR